MSWFWTSPEDRELSERRARTSFTTLAAQDLATSVIAYQHDSSDGRRPVAPCSGWARRLGRDLGVADPECLVLAFSLLDEPGSDEHQRLAHALACLDSLGLSRVELSSLLLELRLLPGSASARTDDQPFEPDTTPRRLALMWGLCALASGRELQPWLQFAAALAEPLALLQGLLDLNDDEARVGPPRVAALLRACRDDADALATMLDACAGALGHVDKSVSLRCAATSPAVLERVVERRERLLADAHAALPASGAEPGAAFLAALLDAFSQSSTALWLRGLMARAAPLPVPPAAMASISISAAADYLVQTRPWTSAWDVHRFHPMGAPCVLTGRWFIEGMILLALTEVRARERHEGDELDVEIATLLERVPTGSARYFPEWNGLPPDADSLGLALQLAAWLPSPPRAHVDSWIAVLEASVGDGSIVPTWFVEGPDGRTTPLAGPFLGDECTAVSLAFLLGALRYDGERFAALFCPNLQLVRERGFEAGSQHYTREFATHLLIRLVHALRSHASARLAALPRELGLESIAAERCATLIASQCLDGGWGSPQATALALEALADWDPSSPCIGRAITYLVHSQGPDGAWPAEPLYITPGKFGGMVPFSAKSLTTALCVRALQRAAGSGERSDG